jgi:membrane protein DedA with SNARE-associated domain
VRLLLESSAIWLYLILFGSAVIESLFPPYPGDTVILVGGYLVGVGRLNFGGALLSSVVGSLCGASILFFLGLAKGRSLFQRGRCPFFSPDRLHKVEGWFDRHGRKTVLASRFLAGVRSLVAVSAGMGRMKYGLFLSFSLVSILAWNGLLLFLGLKFGQSWEHVARLFRIYNGVIIFVAILVILLWYLKLRGHLRFRNR